MNTKILDQLEFNKVKDQFTEYLQTEQAQAELRDLVPMTNPERIQNQFTEIQEMSEIFVEHHSFAIGSLRDISEPLRRLELDADLNIQELIAIKKVLQASADLSRFYADLENVELVALKRLFEKIEAFPSLQGSLQSINDGGFIEHFASPELQNIRRQLKACDDAIRQTLQDILKKSGHMLAENLIASRNGRSVLPVKNTYRNRIAGVVHDISSSGNTVYIEPRAVIQLNEEITQLRADERHEMARILHELSDQLRPHTAAIANNAWILGHMDFIRGKYLYLHDKKAVIPKISDNQTLQLLNVRHPLLINPVANDLRFDEDLTVIVITGPNTGGKTVMLKTLGLAQLMAQSGLPILADKGSRVAIFQEIFADIGDEQSIEQSLSTFSSHMTNIVEIISCVQDNDLVLFDELGAGTDPTEGAALAQSILSSLLERKVRTMATTHYSELKAFALSTPGVENASVEFDVESLRPTYRLSIGIPGKSNAFDISRKLGLPERLIDGAKELLSKEDIRFEDVIANAEYHRQIAEREREIAEETRRETVKLRDEAERLRREIEQSRDKSLKKAKDEARRVLENARREADGIIRELKAMKKQTQTPEHEVQRLKKRMEDGIDALSEGLSEKSSVNFTPPKSVRPGDTVEIVHLGTKGTVLSPADRNGEVQIQAGIIKMKAHISQLRLVEPDKPKQSRVINRVSAAKPAVPMEVDVRGMTLDEAIATVDIYLADATLAGLNEVSIIHGKGTGVLRTGIQRHLRTHMNVKKYRDGMYGEGEQGVTVVTLK